ncbi:MAG TPA: glutathione S-transferase family protein [Xanthobacteraceae bacterium]|nr:glutathione S-transferase family protein [Xanthobacteraceae bacterium]
MALRLVIGNKNYSSWSMRPWMAMKGTGMTFEETVIPLYEPESKAAILRYSPAGKVPILVDGDRQVWESLAIIEYLAEKFPERRLWPDDAGARAHARAISAEMHAGFMPLRRHCPMNFRRQPKARELTAEVKADVARIEAMWTDCRKRYGGPFLFGSFGAADAMYAPVISRFHSYRVEVGAAARDYVNAVMALPAWHEWSAAAHAEPWTVPSFEVDDDSR